MEINISNLIEKKDKLTKKINEYEQTNLDYYNEISNVKTHWNTKKGKDFSSDVDEERKEIALVINNLKDIRDLYSYIIDKYKSYGDKILFDTTDENKIIDNINNYNNKIAEIIKLYDGIIAQYNNGAIVEERRIINNCIKQMNDIKNNTIEKLSDFENIEKDIRAKINKIELEYIKETDISNYL